MIPTGPVAAVALSVAYGALSAVVPVVNAEAYAVAAAASSVATACALGLAGGQTAGKVALFLATRHGALRVAGVLHRRRERGPGRRRRAGAERARGRWWRWLEHTSARLLQLLDQRAWAAPVVLCSAAVGVPPLAVVSIAAGARRTSLTVFTVCCFAGRAARFLALVLPAGAVLR
ncbi:hypothetical protein [Kineococcus glutinatus]|uniref:SNARE associated Golgi protein n=1 Tax=Kineococcus glutinatus TaxID=1070872 RepID=A0ABP9HVZ2_9ACTN